AEVGCRGSRADVPGARRGLARGPCREGRGVRSGRLARCGPMRALVTGLVASSFLWALPAGADENAATAEPPDAAPEMGARAVLLGVHYDQGTSSAFGLSVLHGWEHAWHHDGLGFLQGGGIGVDGRVVTSGHPRVEGVIGYAVGRWSAVGCAGGFGLELA